MAAGLFFPTILLKHASIKGSGWSKGMVPMDTLKELEKQRGIKIDIEKKPSGKVNWDALRVKIKKGIKKCNTNGSGT